MNKAISLILMMGIVIGSLGLVSASNYIIRYDGTDIFKVDTSGNLNATGWLTEAGIKLEDIYVKIADVGTCSAGEFLLKNATGWFCEVPSINIGHAEVTIDGANITTGTIDFDRLPDLTDAITLDYHNITGIPTCSAGDVLTFDGTDLSCVSASVDFTNVAYTNVSNTFSEAQVFSSGMNVTGYADLQSSTSGIRRGSTSITIDDTGNLIITLG